jgi:hypothetical protein
MARFEASNAVRMSLLSLVTYLDADSDRGGYNKLRYVCSEPFDYPTKVFPAALTTLDVDSFI